MTSVTVTISAPLRTLGYLAYYDIIAHKSFSLVLQSPISSVQTQKRITVSTTTGAVFTPRSRRLAGISRIPTLAGITALSTMRVEIQLRAEDIPLSAITLLPNDRSATALNTEQVTIPNTEERHLVVADYVTSGGTLDGLTPEGRQLFSRAVSASVKAPKSAVTLMSTIANNYANKTSPRGISTSYTQRRR